jgi:GDPmannose 4,6-dehydratase
VTDSSSLIRIVQQVQPAEIYNLAAQSHVAVSFEEPEYTADSDALGALRLLGSHPYLGIGEKDALLPGSTSELYGKFREIPSARPRLFIRVHLMPWPNCMHTGSP